MPTVISAPQQQHPIMMRPSFSTNTTSSANSTRFNNAKLAPPITKATVVSFEKRLDQKIWYTIRVEPLVNKKYFISRKYEDFSQFSQKLHDRFNTTKYRAGSRLPPKIKNRLNLLPTSKQIHAQRVQELNQFLSVLFQKQSIITDSFIVLEFFGVHQKTDLTTEKSNSHHLFMEEQQYAAVDYIVDEENIIMEQENNSSTTSSSRWKRLRCTSFLARSPPSTNGLSSLCSQAANKIIPSWHRNNTTAPCSPQPSLSTPAITGAKPNAMMTAQQQQEQQRKQVLKKSKSTLGIYSTTLHHPLDDDISNSSSSSITPSPSVSQQHHQHQHQIRSTIKIKVIYDVDNIIVIQVPRSIALNDLRSKIAQKFSDPSMGGTVNVEKELVLLFNDNSSSCCSIASTSTKPDMMLPAVLINKEQDLIQIMHTKWNRLEKVTLRCIM